MIMIEPAHWSVSKREKTLLNSSINHYLSADERIRRLNNKNEEAQKIKTDFEQSIDKIKSFQEHKNMKAKYKQQKRLIDNMVMSGATIHRENQTLHKTFQHLLYLQKHI